MGLRSRFLKREKLERKTMKYRMKFKMKNILLLLAFALLIFNCSTTSPKRKNPNTQHPPQEQQKLAQAYRPFLSYNLEHSLRPKSRNLKFLA